MGRGWAAAVGALAAAAAACGGAPPAAAPAPARSAPPVPPAPETLAPAARVAFVLAYPACGVTKSGVGPLPPALVGLSRDQVGPRLAPDRVAGFTPELLTVRRDLPGCPVDTATLAVQDGSVVVLAGPPGDTGAVRARTAIAARSLAPEAARRLENGWAVPAADVSSALARLQQPNPNQ